MSRLSNGFILGVLLLFLPLLMSCTNGQPGHRESLLNQLEHETIPPEPVGLGIEQLVFELDTVEVKGDTAVSFHTLTHTSDLVKYPCSTCHETPLADLNSPSEPHLDITLNHAGPDIMNCTTCHDPQNLDSLHSLTNAPIEFDHSYLLCAQCHSSQFEDWVGGAHGKRLEGWAPPRVVETCVGCHNPHDPAWDTRWPAVTGGGIEEQR